MASPEAQFDQQSLIPDETKAAQAAGLEAMRQANATRQPATSDKATDDLRRKNMEDGSGFSAHTAELAVTPLDPDTIVSEGVKRVAALRRTRKPRPQKAHERDLADQNVNEAHFPYGEQGKPPAIPTQAPDRGEPLVYSEETTQAIENFLEAHKPATREPVDVEFVYDRKIDVPSSDDH